MKIIVAGGRDLKVTDSRVGYVADMLQAYGAEAVLSGGAPGGDEIGEKAAGKLALPVQKYPADWIRFGKAAGPIRNEMMSQDGNLLIALPGGTGTADMIRRMKRKEKNIIVVDLQEADAWGTLV
jgi:hypothetical protein